ncbi:MAG: hypothetical protein ACE14S_07675 [Candidatus Bathyarchaeia archaeon]
MTRFNLGKTAVAVLLFLALTPMVLSAQVSAFDYIAMVKVGQYVKYGNFVGTGQGLEAYNQNDWMQWEVTEVNGSEVVLRLTGRFKNGTAILSNGDYWMYYVTLMNYVNNTASGQSPVIAGNLTRGYSVAPRTFDTVNDTQTRTYLGATRTVNILNYTTASENSTGIFTYFYDQESGMLLEAMGQTFETAPTETLRRFSYIVTDTNIFGLGAIPPLYFYATAAVVAAVVVAIAVALKRRATKSGKIRRHRR